jgi:hypothetical protein
MFDEPGAMACRVARFTEGTVNPLAAPCCNHPPEIDFFSPTLNYFWQKTRKERCDA